MRAFLLRFFGRYRPDASCQVEFRPFRRAKLTGPDEGQGEQFERCPRFRRAVIVRDYAKKAAERLGLDNRRAVPDYWCGQGSLQGAGWIGVGASRCYSVAEKLADGRA